MQRLFKSQFINRIMGLLIPGLFFVLPLIFGFYPKVNNAFELPKLLFFKIIVLLLLFLTLYNYLVNKDIRHLYKLLLSFARYLLLPLIFLFVLAISTVFSIDSRISFNGSYVRLQGLSSFVYYILFFVLLIVNIREFKQIRAIITSLAWSSFLVCIYALMQANGYDIFNWSETFDVTRRVTTTFGQPNFFATFLLLVVPFIEYLIFSSKKYYLKIVYAINLIISLFCLYYTISMTAYASLIVGLIWSLAVYWLFIRRKSPSNSSENRERGSRLKLTKKVIIILLVLVSIFSIFNLARGNPIIKGKINKLIAGEGSMAARIQFWSAGVKAIKERPILGYGLDTQSDVLAKYYQADWAIPSNVNVRPSRAHNFVLDTILTTGFLGIIIYIGLFFYFFILLFENIKNNKHPIFSLAISTAIISYLSFIFFNFSIVISEVIFWLLLAITIIIHSNSKDNSEQTEKAAKKYSYNRAIIIILIIFSFGAFIAYKIDKHIDTYIADHYFLEMRRARFQGEFFTTLELYDYVKEIKPEYDYYDFEFTTMMTDWLYDFELPLFAFLGEERLGKILDKITSNTYTNIYTRAKIYTALASEDDQQFYESAENDFKSLIEYSPEMPKNYRELGKLYVKKGDYSQAVASYKKALDILPKVNLDDLAYFHRVALGREISANYFGLGEAYMGLEGYQRSEDNYIIALAYNPGNITIYNRIANTYLAREKIDIAVNYNQKGAEADPTNYFWPFEIARSYKEAGDYTNAIEYANKALELFPGHREVEYFIREIE